MGETRERFQVPVVRPSRFAREQLSVLRKRNRILTPEHLILLRRLSFRSAKPPARCAWPDQTGVKLPAAARTCDRLRQWPLFRSPRAYRRQRRGLPRDPGPPVSPTSHRNLRCAPISSALRHFRLFSATGLTVQQNSLDSIPSPANPLPRLSFRLAGPPAALTLAGYIKGKTHVSTLPAPHGASHKAPV